jgi:hypothetical protein
VQIFSVITGVTSQDPIHNGLPDLDLRLVDSRTLDGRVQVLVYVPTLH